MDLSRLLSAYYLVGTLVFAALDWVLHAPIRAAFLGRPEYRIGYYLLLLGLGVLVRHRPGWAPLIGMGESALNVLLVILSIMLPVLSLSAQVDQGGPIGLPFTSWSLVGALLSGLVFVVAFHRNQAALRGGPPS